jgi:transcriptional regulator GlxA family with amidase domain
VLCGYLACADLVFNPVLHALPRLIHLRSEPGPGAEWRRASLRYAMEAAAGAREKNTELLSRIPELVLVDCLRQYVQGLPAEQTGWLAALKDPVLARALMLLHAQPAQPWTVESLARGAAVSRSVLAERFNRTLGVAPMRYLMQWRLQLAADLLRTTQLGIVAVSARVGYESEAAFSRAFKRHLGVAPAVWRSA